jgi:hypothetical protein
MEIPIDWLGVAAGTVAVSAAVAWPFVKPWIEKLVDRRLDYAFASRLESHKHELGLVAEAAKYDFQKKLANVSLLVTRRHRAYTRAYRAIRAAHGLIVNQRGIRKSPTFEEYNTADVEAYLRGRKAPEGFIDEITDLWDSDRTAATARLVPYARMLELQAAENAFIRAKNELYLNELYFSDPVVEACSRFVDVGSEALAELEYPSPTSAEWRRLRDELTASLEQIHTAMRAELVVE